MCNHCVRLAVEMPNRCSELQTHWAVLIIVVDVVVPPDAFGSTQTAALRSRLFWERLASGGAEGSQRLGREARLVVGQEDTHSL